MLELNKGTIRKRKSHQPSSSNNLILISKSESKHNKHQKNINVVDFIKQKKKFILQNSFDIKGTREFLASKEVAMRVIKLNDEIIEEDKINEEDSYIPGIYDTNVGDECNKMKSDIKKNNGISLKNKFRSNKEIFLDMDFKRFKKELKTIKEGAKESKNDLIHKKKSKKKLKKNTKGSSDKKVTQFSQKKNTDDNCLKTDCSPKKIFSNSGIPSMKNGESQFMFSEVNKKLMADDGLNLSGISNKNLPIKIDKNKVQNDIFSTDIKNNNFKSKFIKKISENVLEEDKNSHKGNEKKDNIKIPLPTIMPINSDKESLISILSDLM